MTIQFSSVLPDPLSSIKHNYDSIWNSDFSIQSGQKVILTLPQNALIDLSTFTMDFKGYTQHNGTNGVTGPTGYCQSRFFPRNIQS